MSETQVAEFNPYDADNMPEGGGLTRENIVTGAKYIAKTFTKKDGTQGSFVGLLVTALRADAEGREDKYEFSAGAKAKPSPDGELLLDETGKPAKIYKNSNLGKFLAGLEAGGYAIKQLYPRVSVLVGSRITFAATPKLDEKGKPKTHVYQGKTYEDFNWFPQTYKGGAGSRTGNGASAGNGSAEIATKAEAAVLAAIVAAGGSIERKDLTRALATSLKGDADAVKVTMLVAQQDFHAGRPWTVDGTTLRAQ